MMEGWKTDKIENIFFLGRGRVINDEEIKDHPGNYPVYSSQTSNNGEFGKVDFYEFEGEYITWTTDGANAGKVFYRSGKFNCTNVCGTLKPKNPQETNVKFFAYLIDRHAFRHVAVVGNNKLMNNVMGKIKITFPADVNQQTAIAAMLSKVDEAIAAVQGSIAAAERLKKSLMQNLLTGRMKPDGTLRKEDEFYVDEKFGKVPKGWEVKRLGHLFNIKAGGDLQEQYYSDVRDEQHVYPIFSNTIVNEGLYGYTSNPRVNAKESLTIVGRGVGVGHIEIRQGNYDAIIRLISLIPKQSNIVDCLYVRYYVEQFVHFAIESTGVPQLTCPRVFSTKIIIPTDVKEQSKIGEMIHRFDRYVKEKQNKIAVLERLKKSLMQNLLTGRVRVNKKMNINKTIVI